MATRRQNTLSPSSSSRLASARLTASRQTSSRQSSGRLASTQPSRAARTVRWGAAVVEPARRTSNHALTDVNGGVAGGRGRRERRSAVRLQGSLPAVRGQEMVGGQQFVGGPGGATSSEAAAEVSSFTRNRIRHAFELFGACMMIVTFLAMAMFA